MGAFQLPDSVLGDAFGCLLYSFVCLFVNCILVWLIWTHHERTSYVAFIAYFTLLATTSSIIQQFYDYVWWRDIMEEQFLHGQEDPYDAEVQYQNEIFGLKLALSYVRIFSIIVEASLVFFFSLSLAATVYGWWTKKPRALRILSIIGRVMPIGFALLSLVLLRLEFTHDSFAAYMIVANAQYIIALGGSCIFLLMILYKYLQSRRQLRTWQTVQYGQGGSRSTITNQSLAKSRQSKSFTYNTSRPSGGSMDNWLVVRLTIALIMLGVFEWTNLAPRFSNRRKVLEGIHESGPDLSEKRAMSTVTGYLSGVSPSMLAFIVFGTTKTFQRKMYRTFVPRFIRKRIGRRGGCVLPGDDDDDVIGGGLEAGPRPANHMPGSLTGSRTRASSIGAPPSYHTSITAVSATTPKRPISHNSSMPSVRRAERGGATHLGPIYEPSCTWLDEDDDDDTTCDDEESGYAQTTRRGLRRSQIGLAVTSSPSLPSGQPPAPLSPTPPQPTFLRDAADTPTPTPESENEQEESLGSIPLSRFNSLGRPRGNSGSTWTSMAASSRRAPPAHARAGSTTPIISEGSASSPGWGVWDNTGDVLYGGLAPPPPRRGSNIM